MCAGSFGAFPWNAFASVSSDTHTHRIAMTGSRSRAGRAARTQISNREAGCAAVVRGRRRVRARCLQQLQKDFAAGNASRMSQTATNKRRLVHIVNPTRAFLAWGGNYFTSCDGSSRTGLHRLLVRLTDGRWRGAPTDRLVCPTNVKRGKRRGRRALCS